MTLANLMLLLVGFAILSDHFERSNNAGSYCRRYAQRLVSAHELGSDASQP